MSLVFCSIEFSKGPTVGLQGDLVSSPVYVNKQQKVVMTETGKEIGQEKQGFSCFSAYLMNNEVMEEGKESVDKKNQFCLGRKSNGSEEELGELSSESSSIAVAGESDFGGRSSTTEDGEEEEVQSKLKGGLGSLDSLEESLPIKRGLSNAFSGKSKSFTNLSDVTTISDLPKQENPFNKRRRTLIASKWSSRRAFYTSLNPTSMPLLALKEDHEEEEENKRDPDDSSPSLPALHERRRKLKNFKSQSCFSLTDLQHD